MASTQLPDQTSKTNRFYPHFADIMLTKATGQLLLAAACLSACGPDSGASSGVNSGISVYSSDGGSAPLDVAGVMAADSGEAAGPTTMFASSACKKDLVDKSAIAHIYGLIAIDDQAGLEGLSCVAWRRVGVGEIKIDLYNYMSACGATWSGDAAMSADGTLELHVNNSNCTVMKCGKCLYDWSFDLNAPIPARQDTQVAIAIDTCKGQQQTVQLSATLGEQDAGISCGLADYGALNEYASAVGTCGKVGMPCVGSLLCGTGSFTSTGTCDSGLVCDSSAAVNEPRCLVPCATTADCPRADAWSCQSGLCRSIVH